VSTVREEPRPIAEQAGPYVALVIGNDDYRFLPRLHTAVQDARAIADLLQKEFGFDTMLLLNADRTQIVSALNQYRQELTEPASFLIYYAGHGVRDNATDRAYWLPVDAKPGDDTNWIIADEITARVRAFPARHVLIISDSCYSGTLTRSLDDFQATQGPQREQQRLRYLQKMLQGKSRTLMSSGGNEPVADSGGSGHSVFAAALLRGLRGEQENSFSAEGLFARYIRETVGGGSRQTPEYKVIQDSGHESGDFVFVRAKQRAEGASRPPAPAAGAPARTTATAASPLVGCWRIANTPYLKVNADGIFRVLVMPVSGRWETDAARNSYKLLWPELEDTAVISSDGRTMNHTNWWFNAVTSIRETPGTDIVGNWRWPNGAILMFRADGIFTVGPLAGTWKLVNAQQRTYKLLWPTPVSTLILSADQQQANATDTYGNSGVFYRTLNCPEN
jgi:hypothetical protein